MTTKIAGAKGRKMPVAGDSVPPQVQKKNCLGIVCGLSDTSKMPGFSYGLSAKECPMGKKYRKIPGSVCSVCYGHKGRYVFGTAERANTRRVQAIKDPGWVDAMVLLMDLKCKTVSSYFRWHDTGEIMNMTHLKNIIEVVRRTPFMHHWLPTKDAAMIDRYLKAGGKFPSNLTVRLSAVMLNSTEIVNPHGLHEAYVYDKPRIKESGAFICPASMSGGPCDECRACWSKRVKAVVYKRH